jgi:hypothetical protein
MQQRMLLTIEDKKILKYEMRLGYVFSFLVLAFGVLFNIPFFAFKRYDLNLTEILLIDLLIICSCILILYFMNRKLVKDLKDGTKKIKTDTVIRKEEKVVYAAGSGALYIPVLADMFPSLFKQGMNSCKKYFFYINNNKFDVDQLIYEKVNEGGLVEMYYSQYSETLLGYGLAKNE